MINRWSRWMVDEKRRAKRKSNCTKLVIHTQITRNEEFITIKFSFT